MKRFVKFRLLKIFAAVIMSIFAVLVNTICVFAAQPEISAKSPDTVNIGNSFDIVFSADTDTNIKAIRIKVSYDSSYLSFKSINKIQSSDINYNLQNNTADIILLFDSTLKIGDIFKLQLTAKTGNKSSEQKITFEVIECVDNDLKDASINISSSTNIKIIKKDEQNSSKKNNSSNVKSTSSSKSSTVNSKSANSSKSTTSSKAVSSSKSRNSSSSKTASKSSSSRVYSSVSKKQSSDIDDDVSKSSESVRNMEEKSIEESKNNTTSISQFREGESIGNLNLKESRSKYVFAGVGGTLSVIGILFAVYRLGQLSKRKPESDKIFPKDDHDDEW